MAPEADVPHVSRSAINLGEAATPLQILKSYTIFALGKSGSETLLRNAVMR